MDVEQVVAAEACTTRGPAGYPAPFLGAWRAASGFESPSHIAAQHLASMTGNSTQHTTRCRSAAAREGSGHSPSQPFRRYRPPWRYRRSRSRRLSGRNSLGGAQIVPGYWLAMGTIVLWSSSDAEAMRSRTVSPGFASFPDRGRGGDDVARRYFWCTCARRRRWPVRVDRRLRRT